MFYNGHEIVVVHCLFAMFFVVSLSSNNVLAQGSGIVVYLKKQAGTYNDFHFSLFDYFLAFSVN